jgi:uncharacterized protein (TIGR03067 family)
MKWYVLCVASAGLLVAAQDPKADAKKEAAKFQGTWIVQTLQHGGQADENAKGDQLIIEGDKFTIKMKQGEMKGTLKFDPAKKPAEIDMTMTDGGPTGTAMGIYAIEGDDLKMALSQPGGTDRPKTLGSKDGDMHMFVVLTREKKK